ncbi:TPA: 50S ribosomal protein L10 [Candidatus Bathyarchaeota archaeon]|nr:50S ribosomal protein L10 [Candidatus Bathyarchaeota archaeon]
MEGTNLQRPILIRKAEKVEEIKSLLRKYGTVGIANLHKVRASQLQELRKRLKGIAYLQVVKNTLMERAISELKDLPDMKNLMDYLEGSNLFLFTDINPFKLALILEKSKVKGFAKAGDIASDDIIVSAGNTGLAPGPIISQLSSVGIPTRIESGSVWINKDTVVAKKGEVISQNLAAVLSKLGIKAFEAGLSLKVVYDNGLIIPEEKLVMDLEEYRQTISEAHIQAFNLSLNAAYPTPENTPILLQIAASEAYRLALNADIPTPQTIQDLIRKAHLEALVLSSKISG